MNDWLSGYRGRGALPRDLSSLDFEVLLRFSTAERAIRVRGTGSSFASHDVSPRPQAIEMLTKCSSSPEPTSHGTPPATERGTPDRSTTEANGGVDI